MNLASVLYLQRKYFYKNFVTWKKNISFNIFWSQK